MHGGKPRSSCESRMRENCASGLSGGRRVALRRPSSDPAVEETSRGLEDARLNCETGGLTRQRAEPMRKIPTAGRTRPQIPPVGGAEVRACLMGSMGTFRTNPWVRSHSGPCAQVRSEPPDTDPYVRWCRVRSRPTRSRDGTRGWLSDPQSVTGTRLALVVLRLGE